MQHSTTTLHASKAQRTHVRCENVNDQRSFSRKISFSSAIVHFRVMHVYTYVCAYITRTHVSRFIYSHNTAHLRNVLTEMKHSYRAGAYARIYVLYRVKKSLIGAGAYVYISIYVYRYIHTYVRVCNTPAYRYIQGNNYPVYMCTQDTSTHYCIHFSAEMRNNSIYTVENSVNIPSRSISRRLKRV